MLAHRDRKIHQLVFHNEVNKSVLTDTILDISVITPEVNELTSFVYLHNGTALSTAAEYRRPQTMKTLLEEKADPNVLIPISPDDPIENKHAWFSILDIVLIGNKTNMGSFDKVEECIRLLIRFGVKRELSCEKFIHAYWKEAILSSTSLYTTFLGKYLLGNNISRDIIQTL